MSDPRSPKLPPDEDPQPREDVIFQPLRFRNLTVKNRPDGLPRMAQPTRADREHTGAPVVDPGSLMDAAIVTAKAAAAVRDAAELLTAGLADRRLAASVARSPVTGARLVAALNRALTCRAGLGYAVRPRGPVTAAAWYAGVLANRRPTAIRLAVLTLRLRIAACAVRHPELITGPVAALTDAIQHDRQLQAVRVVRAMVAEQGVQKTLAEVAPVVFELAAWNGLLDENPFNDDAAWVFVIGGNPTADPILGLPIRWLARLDRGAGRAEPVAADELLLDQLTVTGRICDHLRSLKGLGNRGWILIQRVIGPDGVIRHIVLMPGLEFGKPNTDTPQDLAGAYQNLLMPASTYTRATCKALELAGVPAGSELLFVGHSLGGIAAMNLAADREFAERYKVTHVVAVGSPIDGKRPADPDTVVVSLVNEHDIIPMMDGRGPASPVPLPASWHEFSWLDPSHEFPICHAPDRYIQNLATIAPEAREFTDAAIGAYRGQVTESLVYALFDE